MTIVPLRLFDIEGGKSFSTLSAPPFMAKVIATLALIPQINQQVSLCY